LASRTIKLDIPPLLKRRTQGEIEREFREIWPEVLGALLDGVVAALRDAETIDVTTIGLEPARLMDFERFAEAGCRGMGFDQWEFTRAYHANRKGLMAAAAEAHPVGRAIMAFLKANPTGFVGTMESLLSVLEPHRGNATWRDEWPRDPTRLGSAIRRVRNALAACGIAVETDRNLRSQRIESTRGVTIKRMVNMRKVAEPAPAPVVLVRPTFRR
jgi:hypothetical protein